MPLHQIKHFETGRILCTVETAWADLSRANLRRAELQGADLRKSGLRAADLRGADLSGANLSRASLHHANLSGATLVGADLRRAWLHQTDLRGAVLSGADLRGAHLYGTVLNEADLAGALWPYGVPLKKTPLQISTGLFDILIADHHAQIGCKLLPLAKWAALTEAQAFALGGSDGSELWTTWREPLIAMARAHGCSVDATSAH